MNIHNIEVKKKVLEWVSHAEADLVMAKLGLSLTVKEAYTLVAFHAQQCAEKYLKAYLIFWNLDFPYSHNISLLIELCSEKANWITELEDAEILTNYATTLRYPRIDIKVTKEEAIRAVEIAEHVRDVVRNALNEKGLELE
jgi:HEPN domain-containing protein